MNIRDDQERNEQWKQLNTLTMEYETAVIPFSAHGYLEEFYDYYEIQDRSPQLILSEYSFRDTLREVSGYDVWEPIAEKTESFFGTPKRVMVFDRMNELKDELEGSTGLAPFFFVFDLMFCEYEEFTLCFMSGTNN